MKQGVNNTAYVFYFEYLEFFQNLYFKYVELYKNLNFQCQLITIFLTFS